VIDSLGRMTLRMLEAGHSRSIDARSKKPWGDVVAIPKPVLKIREIPSLNKEMDLVAITTKI